MRAVKRGRRALPLSDLPDRQRKAKIGTPFADRIDRSALSPGGCWPWTGGVNNCGYGVFGKTVGDRVRFWLAHRHAYELIHGEIPPRLVVRHRCDTPACCNPDHLQIGTRKENHQDTLRRDRVWRGGSRKKVA